jgi:hypothetical protein
MLRREEDYLGSLEGICGNCSTKQEIPFCEELHLQMRYKVGTCPGCAYEHSILVGRL